jgi:hypothetical protein
VCEIWDGIEMSFSSEILKDVKMHKPRKEKKKKRFVSTFQSKPNLGYGVLSILTSRLKFISPKLGLRIITSCFIIYFVMVHREVH